MSTSSGVRFPLPASLFPPMKVQSDQAMQFAATCDRIVDSTLAARREYVNRYHRLLDPATWQLVKRRTSATADLAIHKPRHPARAPATAASMNASPILIGTGTMEGSLDEVMLGLTATNTSAMRFVTSTMFRNVADARVLTRIDTPNDVDPFAFLGFKWVVKVPSKKLLPLARARDFIYLESTGVRELGDSSGQRVGFQLMHSVDLSWCPALPMDLGVVRGYMSFCLLFVETPNNGVEVFCKGFVDPRGGLSRRLTISVAADVIMDCEHAVKCAQRKKIEWAVKEVGEISSHSDGERQSILHFDCEAILSASATEEPTTSDLDARSILGARQCINCCTSKRRRSTVTTWGQESSMCEICSERVCSSCSRPVRLSGAASVNETTICCMSCIDRAETVDAASFARELAQRAMAFQPHAFRFSSKTKIDSPVERPRLAPIQKRLVHRYSFEARRVE